MYRKRAVFTLSYFRYPLTVRINRSDCFVVHTFPLPHQSTQVTLLRDITKTNPLLSFKLIC